MSLKSQIESLLFVANKPLTSKELAGFLKTDKKAVDEQLAALMQDYTDSDSGLQVIENSDKYQIVSSAANSQVVSDFIHDETSGELSRPSLETLTIIAYRGPITKIDLDRIRGVNCSLIVRNLLIRGLIEEKFDKEKNETYYAVTLDFIRYLGINKVNDLPDYERLNKDESIEKMINAATQVEQVDQTAKTVEPEVLPEESVAAEEAGDEDSESEEDEELDEEENEDEDEEEDEDEDEDEEDEDEDDKD
ncbi:MAG: SMC-Scp complex subunit ScpB [Candidatus Falkowbacteria bacterium]